MAAESKCREDLILRCEQNKVDNVPGLARNKTRPTLFGESPENAARHLAEQGLDDVSATNRA